MKTVFLATFILASLASIAMTQTPQELDELWQKDHITKKFPSDVRHVDLKAYMQQIKDMGVDVKEVGRSFRGREIYQAQFGRGPIKVFMWSQMHGDEPTATSALIDMLAALHKNREQPWVQRIAASLTIRAVPMLNPDGADAFTRRNAQGIDINRDAINLVTPEAQLLKRLRDEWNPAIGFNLHNQQELTTVARTGKQAAISLLVVYGDAAKTPSPGHQRNTRIASAIATALSSFIPGHIGRYDDGWTPTAFGDNFSAWGTPTILIETGALHGKDERYLVKMNFIAFLTALNALATGSEASVNPETYLAIPKNGSGGLVHFVFRRATPMNGLTDSTNGPVDITAAAERRRAEFLPSIKIRSVTPSALAFGLEEFDASGFYVVPRFGFLRSGDFAELLFYKKGRTVDFASENLEKAFPPDAIFSTGRWIAGKDVVPRIK